MMRVSRGVVACVNVRRCVIAAAIVMIAAGCARQGVHVATPQAMSTVEREVRDALAVRLKQVRSMRASGHLTTHDGGQFAGTVAVAVSLPDQVRIDAIDSLADVTMAAGARGTRAWVWLPADRVLRHGRASQRSIRQVLGVEMDISELRYALAGVVDVSSSDALVRDPADTVLFRVHGRDVAVLMDMKRLEPRGFIVYDKAQDGAEPRLTVFFDNYRAVGGMPFPHRITAYTPHTHESVTIEYDRVELNADIANAVFDAPHTR